jgi:glycosyltransferase involved in cell wall biosynthesis
MKVALLGPYPFQVTEAFFTRLRDTGQGKLPDVSRGRGIAGGVDTTMLALVRGMAERPGVELHVLISVPQLPETGSEVLPRLTIHFVPHPRGDRLCWHLPSVRWLRQTLESIGPDIVHAQMTGHYAGAALQSRRPAVITVQGIIHREAALAREHSSLSAQARWMVDAWYERWVLHRASDLIVTSPYSIEEMRPFTRARFHEIENPIPDEFFDVPDMTEDHCGSPRLLCPARVIPRKDIINLLGAFVLVRAEFPGAILEIAGQTDADPEYMADCLRTTERLGLSTSVRFLGNLHGTALVDGYARSHLVVLSSRQETAPLAISEAMAAGRPVVATAVGGVAYMVAEGRTGLLAEPGDARKLAEAITKLLSDRGRLVACGGAARVEAERRFRLKTVVDQTLALYAGLMEG